MDERPAIDKSCDPQRFSDEEPSHAWDLEMLGRYAQRQHQAILAKEKDLTPAYWRLGQALQIARKCFTRGQWGKYLADLDIDKTRASKARAIFATFSTAQEVAGLPVEEAYSQRQRRQTYRPREKSLRAEKDSLSLGSFLDRVAREVKRLEGAVAKVEPHEAHQFLMRVDRALEHFERLRDDLQQQADSSVGLANLPKTARRPKPANPLGRVRSSEPLGDVAGRDRSDRQGSGSINYKRKPPLTPHSGGPKLEELRDR